MASEVRVNQIQNQSGLGTVTFYNSGQVFSGITTVPSLYVTTVNDGPISGARNRIINGDMRLDQRNAGASVTVAGLTGDYTLDRWKAYEFSDGAATIIRSATAPVGFSSSLLWTTTTADASLAAGQFAMIEQRIEGFNISDLAWGTSSAKPVTLSFYVRSSLTGTFSGAIVNGTSPSDRSYVFNYTISSANTWEYETITIPGDTTGTWNTDNTTGMVVRFSMGSGTTYQTTANAWTAGNFLATSAGTSVIGTLNATFYVTGVQLEAGSTATPFERRSYGQELALCQRYYQKSYELNTAIGINTSNGRTFVVGRCTGTYVDYGNTIFFPVRMRSQPTMKFYTQTGTADSWFNTSGTNPNPSYNNRSESEFSLYITDATTAGQAGFMYGHWTSSAEL